MVTWLSVVSIRASPNLDILGVKFDSKVQFEDNVCCIVFHVPQRIGILRYVKRIFVDTTVLIGCNFAFVLRIFEYWPVLGSAAECHLQLLERQAYSVANNPYSLFFSSDYAPRCILEEQQRAHNQACPVKIIGVSSMVYRRSLPIEAMTGVR